MRSEFVHSLRKIFCLVVGLTVEDIDFLLSGQFAVKKAELAVCPACLGQCWVIALIRLQTCFRNILEFYSSGVFKLFAFSTHLFFSKLNIGFLLPSGHVWSNLDQSSCLYYPPPMTIIFYHQYANGLCIVLSHVVHQWWSGPYHWWTCSGAPTSRRPTTKTHLWLQKACSNSLCHVHMRCPNV